MGIDIKVTVNVTEATNELLKGPAKSVGNITTTCIDFIHNTVVLPLQIANIYIPIKLQEFESYLKKRIINIPQKKLCEPDINIWGTVLDALKWNLDKEHIKEAFINILISDIHKDYKDKVHPAFIELVKQLSSDDAKFLHNYLHPQIDVTSYLDYRGALGIYDIVIERNIPPYSLEGTSLSFLTNDAIETASEVWSVIPNSNGSAQKIDGVIISNLERLKIIGVGDHGTETDEQANESSMFRKIKSDFNLQDSDNKKIRGYMKKTIYPTALGFEFLKIIFREDEIETETQERST